MPYNDAFLDYLYQLMVTTTDPNKKFNLEQLKKQHEEEIKIINQTPTPIDIEMTKQVLTGLKYYGETIKKILGNDKF